MLMVLVVVGRCVVMVFFHGYKWSCSMYSWTVVFVVDTTSSKAPLPNAFSIGLCLVEHLFEGGDDDKPQSTVSVKRRGRKNRTRGRGETGGPPLRLD